MPNTEPTPAEREPHAGEPLTPELRARIVDASRHMELFRGVLPDHQREYIRGLYAGQIMLRYEVTVARLEAERDRLREAGQKALVVWRRHSEDPEESHAIVLFERALTTTEA